jgi:hypothetical protein
MCVLQVWKPPRAEGHWHWLLAHSAEEHTIYPSATGPGLAQSPWIQENKNACFLISFLVWPTGQAYLSLFFLSKPGEERSVSIGLFYASPPITTAMITRTEYQWHASTLHQGPHINDLILSPQESCEVCTIRISIVQMGKPKHRAVAEMRAIYVIQFWGLTLNHQG